MTETETSEERAKSRLLKLLPAFAEANQTLGSFGLDEVDATCLLLDIEKRYGIDFDGLYRMVSEREGNEEAYDNRITLADVLSYMVQQGKTEPVAVPQ